MSDCYPRIDITYVDGQELSIDPSEWGDVRGDGVDEVFFQVGHELGTKMSGHSVYWVYREEDAWVVGCGTVGDQPLTHEALYHDDGRSSSRPVGEYMPDLHHADIKLGWWRPGTVGRVIA